MNETNPDRVPSVDEFGEEMKRLIDAHYPGRGVDSFVGWTGEMRRTHGHHTLRLLRSAVSLYIDKRDGGDGLPTPGEFRNAVEAAQIKAEEDEAAGLLTSDYPDTPAIDWADPWSSTAVERQAWAKEDQEIRGWYRTIMRHRDPPDLLWRVVPVERAAIISAMLNDDQVGNRAKLRPGDRRRFYTSPDPDVRNFLETRTPEEMDGIVQARERWREKPLDSARAAVLAIRPRPDGLDEHVQWYLRHARSSA